MKPKDDKGPRKTAAKPVKSRTTPVRKTKATVAKVAVPAKATAKTATAAQAPVKTAASAPATTKISTTRARKTKAATVAASTPKVVPVAPVISKAKRTSRVTPLKIPPVLMEGDAPPAPMAGGPGQRYALGPTPPVAHALSAGAPLPESYGTQQLFLAARDPHWLYAHWDFSREQLKKYNALSTDGHLALRVFRGAVEGEPLAHIHLHPESRSWFAPVPDAGAKYLVELGYLQADHKWVSLARSGATFTPPDSLSEDTSIRFATIPAEVPFAELLALVKGAVREHVPLVEAMQQMRAQGFRDLPEPEAVQSHWTPSQEKALAEVISMDDVRRIWIGPLEITELIRRQILQHVSSIGAAQFSLPTSPTTTLGAAAGVAGVSSVSSPLGGVSSPSGGGEGQRGFWFNVNAELIIYGATEPDAKVTLGDRPIKLRPDGSFSFRFALPDGHYSLPASAHSADGVETRRAKLQFSRETTCHGEVAAHPQDKKLKPPAASAAD